MEEEKDRCPFCMAPIKMEVGHSCQDSEKDEHYHMVNEKEGPCRTIRTREWDEMPNQVPGVQIFEKGSIIHEGN